MIPDLCDVTGLKWATASMLPSAAGNIRQNIENMIRKNAVLKSQVSQTHRFNLEIFNNESFCYSKNKIKTT